MVYGVLLVITYCDVHMTWSQTLFESLIKSTEAYLMLSDDRSMIEKLRRADANFRKGMKKQRRLARKQKLVRVAKPGRLTFCSTRERFDRH